MWTKIPLQYIKVYYYSILASFFHTSSRDSKSPQFYRTILSIRADFNSSVDWMVSILLLFFSSSSFFFSWRRFQVLKLQLITLQPSCSTASLSPRQNQCISLSLRFLLFSIYGSWKRQKMTNYFLLLIDTIPGFQQGLGDLFISQNPREFCEFYFLGRIK